MDTHPRRRYVILAEGKFGETSSKTAIGVIPYVSGAAYAAAAVFGLGAMTVAVWRARGPSRGAKPGGKHRAGVTGATPTDTSAAPTTAATNETGSREAPGL